MSAAPRPYSMPSRCVGTKGSLCQASSGPVGTTSVWPAKASTGAAGDAPRRIAHRLLTGCSPLPKTSDSQSKPSARRRCASSAWQPASRGVTEAAAISCSVSCRVRSVMRSDAGNR